MTWNVSSVWCEICFTLKRAQEGWKTKKLCIEKTYLYSCTTSVHPTIDSMKERSLFGGVIYSPQIPLQKERFPTWKAICIIHVYVPLLLSCHCSSSHFDCCHQYSSQYWPKKISDHSFSKVVTSHLISNANNCRLQSLLVESFSIWLVEVWSSYVLVPSAELQQPKL